MANEASRHMAQEDPSMDAIVPRMPALAAASQDDVTVGMPLLRPEPRHYLMSAGGLPSSPVVGGGGQSNTSTHPPRRLAAKMSASVGDGQAWGPVLGRANVFSARRLWIGKWRDSS